MTFDYDFPTRESISFARTFKHTNWVDGEDVVQATGGEGFNERFHKIEFDLDGLGSAFELLNTTRSDIVSLVKAIKDAFEAMETQVSEGIAEVKAVAMIEGKAIEAMVMVPTSGGGPIIDPSTPLGASLGTIAKVLTLPLIQYNNRKVVTASITKDDAEFKQMNTLLTTMGLNNKQLAAIYSALATRLGGTSPLYKYASHMSQLHIDQEMVPRAIKG